MTKIVEAKETNSIFSFLENVVKLSKMYEAYRSLIVCYSVYSNSIIVKAIQNFCLLHGFEFIQNNSREIILKQDEENDVKIRLFMYGDDYAMYLHGYQFPMMLLPRFVFKESCDYNAMIWQSNRSSFVPKEHHFIYTYDADCVKQQGKINNNIEKLKEDKEDKENSLSDNEIKYLKNVVKHSERLNRDIEKWFPDNLFVGNKTTKI